MNEGMESKVYNDFKGYRSYPLEESEKLIRGRLISNLNGLIQRNDECLIKARDQGREKLASEILTLKTRMERLRDAEERSSGCARYKIEKISDSVSADLWEIDLSIESLIDQCMKIIDDMTCSEPDRRITDSYARINGLLSETESAFRRRSKIFRMMNVFG